jgi:Alpha/beta hydrolase
VTVTTYAQLRVTDPLRWRTAALAWRAWAALAGRWSAEFGPLAGRLKSAWSGVAATAALARLGGLRRVLNLFRLLCWQADQALSEFAAALARARALLTRAMATAKRSGLVIDDDGRVRGRPAEEVTSDLSAALTVATAADVSATARLGEVATTAAAAGVPPPPPTVLPPCSATPAEVHRWWETLTPEQRRWLVATEPGWLGPLDGVPAAYRDLANRLLLDERRAALDDAAGRAHGSERRRVHGLQDGLGALADRLATGSGPRAYLLRLDLAGEGRAVVAIGDPDSAANVVTHVPGMTADLASYQRELARAERVAVRAAELGPATATSAVMWLDYDAPDFVDEAASASRADAGVAGLRRFQDGLRATHDGGSAHQTVLGHSYGSLVVGKAAASPGFEADSVVFVGSPGVGVDSAADLHVPAGQVWSTTSRDDVIQYLPVAPRGMLGDLVTSALMPAIGPAIAFGRPGDDLWFGRNPSDPGFGAHVFASQPHAGHLGYWDPGRPALDRITEIALGTAR